MKLGQSDPRNRVTRERTDRAVSPVIGVILMVAITVILAAVIGVFVLGLGDELGDAAPSNSLDIDEADNVITISHESGDSVEAGDVDVIIVDDGDTERDSLSELTDLESDDEFSVGDVVDFAASELNAADASDVEVRLVHTPSDSTIASEEFDEFGA